MAEIKSTLDLVLEKTRDMTLSSDEKQQQQREAIETRFRGLLQKYIDGSLTREQYDFTRPSKRIHRLIALDEEKGFMNVVELEK